MADQTLFEMPNVPEGFGVALAPASLRRLDFSALDFDALNRSGIEYIRTYFPNEHNDFFSSNGVIMFLELVSWVGNTLSERSDILADEAFLPTAQTKQAVIQHLALINQQIARATPAIVDVEASINSSLPVEVRIPAGLRFTLTGPDNLPVFYEIYRAPGDFTSYISIPPGKRGIVAYGIEGSFQTPIQVTSVGGPNQYVEIDNKGVLDEPIIIDVVSGEVTTRWRRVAILQEADPQDEVFEVRHFDRTTRIIFGDDNAGKAPISGQVIQVRYRIGGGVRGRAGSNVINEIRPINPQPPATASVEVQFRNPAPSSGGTDEESLEQAKVRAPLQYATHASAITGEDYGLMAAEFSHPVFGAVSKAMGIIRTGVDQDITAVATAVRAAPTLEEAVVIMQTQFINRNIVELYALAEGPESVPVVPSSGLKQGLITYFDELNVLTDEVRVYNGAVKPVEIEATIVLSRNSDPGTVKVAVDAALQDFFDIRNFEMGSPLFVSSLYKLLQDISGIKYVDIFKPVDDILPTRQLADPASPGVGFNELITLGQVNLRFFFEPGTYTSNPTR